jgi:hypothetical protein
LRKKSLHAKLLLAPVIVAVEHSDNIPVRRLVRAFGLGEDADVQAGDGFLRAIDVGEAEHLATERVQNEAGDVSILEAIQCACPIIVVLGDDGSSLVEIHELEEQEGADGHDGNDTAEDLAHGVTIGVGEVGRDEMWEIYDIAARSSNARGSGGLVSVGVWIIARRPWRGRDGGG